jgi:catechol 2,3-dioxygenase-like lactoylglutathione lyase family enzyme
MVKRHGLTHISLDVRDPERSLRFYEQVFGVREYYPDESSIQALGPGTHAVLAFERNVSSAMSRAPAGMEASSTSITTEYHLSDPLAKS